jgi:signal transduction histidine kinase
MTKPATRILLIEDDGGDYDLFIRCLAKCRAQLAVSWHSTLMQGLERLREDRFDVVITDLSLSDASDMQAVRRIREVDQKIPIIVLTTLDNPAAEIAALEFGAQDYLIKEELTPTAVQHAIEHAICRQELRVRIEQLLSDNHAQRELLQRKNRRLKKVCKTAHRFVDNVSHEFRTPLTVIKDYVALVREGFAGEVNDEQGRMLNIASVRADDLNNMVDDMLDVSRLQSGLLVTRRETCRLEDVVGELQASLKQKAEVKEISFQTDIEESLPDIYCDPEKLGRVLINLTANAMKFCGEPGRVRLWARLNAAQHEIVVGVTDNGAGIDSVGLSQIFKRFKQLKTGVKSSTKGFGLGLSIAKELVDLNFGSMHVESELGQSSTFSFTVPLAEPVEVMRRYLLRAERSCNGPSFISIVRARLEPSVAEADSKAMNAFFNNLLRHKDLLFRESSREWLYVLSTQQMELGHFMARAKSEWEKVNRNRPFGPLPRFEIDVEYTCPLATNRDTILESVRSIYQPEHAHTRE